MKVLILQGGYNEEHKVSLKTAKQIGKALTKLKIDFKNFTVAKVLKAVKHPDADKLKVCQVKTCLL